VSSVGPLFGLHANMLEKLPPLLEQGLPKTAAGVRDRVEVETVLGENTHWRNVQSATFAFPSSN